jgi:hypothetical protein
MSGESERPEHDDVRRLLAQARHDEPMPADVAARMEALLTGLARTEPLSRDADVVPFGSRHRRRKAAQLLVAAAAVVVGGVGVSHLHLSSANNSEATAASSNDQLGDTGNAAAGGRSLHSSTPGAAKSTQMLPVPQLNAHSVKVRNGRIVVRPGHFSADVQAAQPVLAPNTDRAAARDFGAAGCVAAPAHSTVVPASYEHAPAALVYRRPEGSTRVVDLFLCGRPTPVRSVTLALP